MSDTPRTTKAIQASGGQWSFFMADEMEKLERELNQAKTIIRQLMHINEFSPLRQMQIKDAAMKYILEA